MKIDGIDYLGIDRVLKRGSGEIIEELDDAILVRDSISGAYFAACEDTKNGLALLDRYVTENCNLLMTVNCELGQAAFKRYGFSGKMECYQVAYYGKKPALNTELRIKTADERDLDILRANYHLISPEELENVVKRGCIFLGYYQNRLAGFIGEHLEGSMGLLYVFPEYRRRGFGTALQTYLIAKTLERDLIPFAQVEKDNVNSLNLQKKLGMEKSDHLIVWVWK